MKLLKQSIAIALLVLTLGTPVLAGDDETWVGTKGPGSAAMTSITGTKMPQPAQVQMTLDIDPTLVFSVYQIVLALL